MKSPLNIIKSPEGQSGDLPRRFFQRRIEWNRRFAWKLLHALYDLEIPQALRCHLGDFMLLIILETMELCCFNGVLMVFNGV